MTLTGTLVNMILFRNLNLFLLICGVLIQPVVLRPGNTIPKMFHIENTNIRKMKGMSLQQADDSQVEIVVVSDQSKKSSSDQNQQQQQKDQSVSAQTIFTTNAGENQASSQGKVSKDQNSNQNTSASLFSSSSGGKVSSSSSSTSLGKISNTAGAKTSFSSGSIKQKQSSGGVSVPISSNGDSKEKQGVKSVVSVTSDRGVSFQTVIDGKQLTLRPVSTGWSQQQSSDSQNFDLTDFFYDQMLPVDKESKSAFDSAGQSSFVARQAFGNSNNNNNNNGYKKNNKNDLTCPDAQTARDYCPFQGGYSQSQNVTDFYNHLVGSCNHFVLNGPMSFPSLQQNECCSKLQNMWQDQQKKQIITYCSCNTDFKCMDNFGEFGVLGPFYGSNIQDLLNYCGIGLDSSAATCS